MIHPTTIIIPTLWKSPDKLLTMLKRYNASPYVSEIILIDNATEGPFFGMVNRVLLHKLVIEDQFKNIYVNPAWNLGVSLATTNHVALVNDDLLISEKDLEELFRGAFRALEYGMQLIGMANSVFTKRKGVTAAICREITKKGYGFGTFMLMHKSNYVPIPEELKIWRGDHIQLIHNRTAELSGIYIETEMSETIKTDAKFNRIGRNDIRIFKEKYKGKDLRELAKR